MTDALSKLVDAVWAVKHCPFGAHESQEENLPVCSDCYNSLTTALSAFEASQGEAVATHGNGQDYRCGAFCVETSEQCVLLSDHDGGCVMPSEVYAVPPATVRDPRMQAFYEAAMEANEQLQHELDGPPCVLCGLKMRHLFVCQDCDEPGEVAIRYRKHREAWHNNVAAQGLLSDEERVEASAATPVTDAPCAAPPATSQGRDEPYCQMCGKPTAVYCGECHEATTQRPATVPMEEYVKLRDAANEVAEPPYGGSYEAMHKLRLTILKADEIIGGRLG